MESKRITSLNSLMIFTGSQANKNAYALEDRQYDIFSDEYIGTLKLTEDFDSVFNATPSEIFVETPPKYKSIKDITEIACAYIVNKSKVKPTDRTSMFIDKRGVINFEYDFEKGLSGKIDNTKLIPLSDLMLYFSSINNAMFNKQKYYSQHKEIESISNVGVKYFWKPDGSYFDVYDKATEQDYKYNCGNDFITYTLTTYQVQAKKWDAESNSYVPIFDEKNTGTAENPVIEKVPRMINKNVLESINSIKEVFASKLSDLTDAFKTKHDEKLLSYYLYELNTTLPVVANTYTFGQNTIDVNLNYDGEFNNWFNNRISFAVSYLTSNDLVKVTPAENYWFNLAIVDSRFIGEDKRSNTEITFSVNDLEKDSFEDISILSPYKIKKLDFSPAAEFLTGSINLLCEYNKKINSKDYVKTDWEKEKGSKLEELIIGKEGINCKLENIIGLDRFDNLRKIVLTGCNNLKNNPDLSNISGLEEYYLGNSNISVFNPKPESYIKKAQLPESIESIILNSIEFEDEDSLDYIISDNLTTLELNNVEGLDTYEFISEWIEALKKADKLDSGVVNYVNINGVKWNAAHYKLLKELAIAELNEFSGEILVDGDGPDRRIYRKDYRELVDIFGQENVFLPGKDSEDTDLFIRVVVPNHAFDLNVEVVEEYQEPQNVQDEFGEWSTIMINKKRKVNDIVVTIEDTLTGNSLIDNIVANPEDFANISRTSFINANNIEIGWKIDLKNPLVLPDRSTKVETLEIGDILLFGKQTLIIVTKNTTNVNQNFTKVGKVTSSNILDVINYNFAVDCFFTLTSIEDEIEIPEVDEDGNYIEVEYGPGSYIEVEYGEGNYIDVEYGKE